VRLYDYGGDTLPSVTTALKTRDGDKSNLNDWKDRNDGVDGAANHKHLFWYSRHVGTLGHWSALSQLDSDLPWTEDESQSLTELSTQDADEVTSDPARDVLYSILRGDKNKAGGSVSTWGEFFDRYSPYRGHDYYKAALVDRAMSDVDFFTGAQQRLWHKLGVNNIIAVEQYLFNERHGYAGQVDLVYEDEDGYTVVADLKSSSGCYRKHQLQGAAYGKAVEVYGERESESNERLAAIDTVDRLEVHRAHPRTGQMAAHTHSDAPGQRPVHTTDYWRDGFDTLWEEFATLASVFDYDKS